MAVRPPWKRLGQHFLIDGATIDAILAAVGESRVVVEIGPGRGALTRRLAAQAQHLYAIEKDASLAASLQREFVGEPSVSIKCADALREDLTAYPNGLRVVGNLPYNVATALLQQWMGARTHLTDLTVMVQREVAQRLVAPPGDPARGQLSVVVQLLMEVAVLLDVEPGCFDPPPQVMSSVVRLVPRRELPMPEGAWQDFARLAQQAFASRRKTLRNNFPKLPAAVWTATGIDPGRRAETLSGDEFVRLFRTSSRAC